MNVCALPIYDIWHPSLKKSIDPNDFINKCNKSIKPLTELVNGTWRVLEEGVECTARCFEGIGNSLSVKFGNSIPPGPVDCEFLQTTCNKNSEVYEYVHTQIKPKPKFNSNNENSRNPNVFVFLVDSLNVGMAKRFLPKTTSFLTEKLKSVEFPFVNIVGENSKPNGFALWFGKQIEKGMSVAWKDVNADWNNDEYCERYLDDKKHIFREFKEAGYKTVLMEDWKETMIDNFPKCSGFKNQQVDHQIRPLFSVSTLFGNVFSERREDVSCLERHHAVLEYYQQFIDAYKDDAMFSFMWIAAITHGSFNGIQRADNDFLKLLEKNQDLFENSFVIFMGDHGLRAGDEFDKVLSQIELGKFERNNPYLSISIPKKYRSDEILKVMKENAEKLQTHYDTRSTILDILKYQPESQFSNHSLLEIPDEKGNSLLRKQPNYPRTCGTLPIPQQYCICQVEKFNVVDNNIRSTFGRKLVDYINEVLNTSFADLCVEQRFKETTKMTRYEYSNFTTTYQISVKTKSPGEIHVEAFVIHNELTSETRIEKPVRLDNYGPHSRCAFDREPNNQNLCYCKNSLPI